MKKLLILLSISFFIDAADLPDESGKKIIHIYRSCDQEVLELPHYAKINAKKYECLPQEVLAQCRILSVQEQFKGSGFIFPCSQEKIKTFYPLLQAHYLKEKGDLRASEYEHYLNDLGVQKLYQCAAVANALQEDIIFKHCTSILKEPHAVSALMRAAGYGILNQVIESDLGVQVEVAQSLVNKVFTPELTGVFESEVSKKTLELSHVRLKSLSAGILLAFGEDRYDSSVDSFYILRPGEEPLLESGPFLTGKISSVSIEHVSDVKSLITASNVNNGEIKVAVYRPLGNKLAGSGFYVKKSPPPELITRISQEYMVTTHDCELLIHDLRGKKEYWFGGIFLKPILLLESQKRINENVLYIGLSNGDFSVFNLDALRKDKNSLLNNCESFICVGLDADPASIIKSIANDPLHSKQDVVFLGRRSGKIICYSLQEKDTLYTDSLGEGLTSFDLHPTNGSLVLTAHNQPKISTSILSVWRRTSKDFSLLWSDKRESFFFRSPIINDACWSGKTDFIVSFENTNQIEQISLKKVFDFMRFVKKNQFDLKTILALLIARDKIKEKTGVAITNENIKEIVEILPDPIKEKIGLLKK